MNTYCLKNDSSVCISWQYFCTHVDVILNSFMRNHYVFLDFLCENFNYTCSWSSSCGRPVRLSIGPPFGSLDHILSCSSSFVGQLLDSSFYGVLFDEKTGLQSTVQSLTGPNYCTLLSHLRLCSLLSPLTARRDYSGWRYSNPPPHKANYTVFICHIPHPTVTFTNFGYRKCNVITLLVTGLTQRK
jgi:hypothetical protein